MHIDAFGLWGCTKRVHITREEAGERVVGIGGVVPELLLTPRVGLKVLGMFGVDGLTLSRYAIRADKWLDEELHASPRIASTPAYSQGI
jgi:hypothetical protein